MTLLEDVNIFIEGMSYDRYIDAEDVAEEISASVEEEDIPLGDMRWGQIKGAVLCRGLNGQFEYVMITQYVYSGDSDGPNDAEAYAVTPIHIQRTEWERA